MKGLSRLSVALLLFTGLTALYGGINLIIDPTGQRMQMPLELLRGAFPSYLLPGIVLSVAIGLGSLLSAWAVGAGWRFWPRYLLASGLLLTAWIGIQAVILEMLHPLQVFYGLLGLLLCSLGARALSRLQQA